jgi:chromosome segregation ATPase
MKTTVENLDIEDDITECVTGEYPAINRGDVPPAELRSVAPAAAEADAEKAAFWLTHLELEVKRLHSKWHSIDAEFRLRESRIAELRGEVKGRDAVVAKLNADLRRGADELQAAEQRLAAKDVDIAGWVAAVDERDRKLQQLTALIAAAEERYRALEASLENTRAEVARLNGALRREQEATAGVVMLNGELLAEQRALQGKVQDLETYIDGRHGSWAQLNAQLARYKDSLAAIERTVDARDVALARFEDEKRALAVRIGDLERQCAELAGRRKDGEAAYEELQAKLAEHLESSERLKAEHAARAKIADDAIARAASSEELVASLRRDVAQRDENVAALGAQVATQKISLTELSASNEALTKRMHDLEGSVSERTQESHSLRDELQAAQGELRTLRDEFGRRGAQLDEARGLAEEKTHLAGELARDLNVLEQDAAQLRDQFARLEEHSAELGRLRSEALMESEQLKRDLAAQQQLVATLETQLRAKQQTADLLERNVSRITDLGASLAALDRQMDGSEPRRAPSGDFIATLASDAAPPKLVESSKDLLPADALLDKEPSADILRIGKPAQKRSGVRKLVAMLGGQGIDYPLIKKEMTIGRGHGSDIRIASHFISRIHAKVSTQGIATYIEDAGSKNGVLVNSERIQRRVLRDGDIVSLGGELNLRFVDGAP